METKYVANAHYSERHEVMMCLLILPLNFCNFGLMASGNSYVYFYGLIFYIYLSEESIDDNLKLRIFLTIYLGLVLSVE